MWALLFASLALAGVPEDLHLAADTDLPTDVRQAAFARVIATNKVADVTRIADDAKADPAERWVAIRALGTMTAPEARDAIAAYLDAKDATTRIAALGAAGDRGDRTLSGRMAARLEDKALLVRVAAADALGRLKDPSTIGDLERALGAPDARHKGASLWVRRAYVDAIAAIGGDYAAPALGRALNDDDAEVVDAAVAGLERIAGFSYAEGRSREEMLEAWRRWSGSKGK
jgi:HEAT repeat protein